MAERDYIVRATAADEFIRAFAITSRGIAERARRAHDLTPVATAALGRLLSAAAMMGVMMKEDKDVLTVRIDASGPLNGLLATADSHGNVKGYVGNPNAEAPDRPDGHLGVGAAVGIGVLSVIKDLGLKEPYVGSVELISGEIAEDFTAYLTESEQVPSACGLGVLVDTDTSIKAAGGFLVQLMPGADESLITKLEENIFLMDQLTTILGEDGAEAVFAQVMKDIEYHIVGREEIGYRCFCSHERAAEAVACIDPADLDEMIAEGKNIEVGCQFCDARYIFSPEDMIHLRKKEEKTE